MMSFLFVDTLIIFAIKSVGFGVGKSWPRPKMLISSFVPSVAVPTSLHIVKILTPFSRASLRNLLYCGLEVPLLPKTIRFSFSAASYLSLENLQCLPAGGR